MMRNMLHYQKKRGWNAKPDHDALGDKGYYLLIIDLMQWYRFNPPCEVFCGSEDVSMFLGRV